MAERSGTSQPSPACETLDRHSNKPFPLARNHPVSGLPPGEGISPCYFSLLLSFPEKKVWLCISFNVPFESGPCNA